MSVKGMRPKALTDVPFHYCPGCTHGIVHRLVAEVIDELGCEGKTVGVASVGCSVFTYNYFNCFISINCNMIFALCWLNFNSINFYCK